MLLRDNTMEANEREGMQTFYLYHVESPYSRWALGVEHVSEGRFQVVVELKEKEWDVAGAVRYWVFEDRAMAEARYLELQRLFEDLDEEAELKSILAVLPEVERHWGQEHAEG